MRRLGIIQPGKIGDIIICLPIAKWYADKGYEVIWPVDKNIINNFIGYIDYVNFIPIDFNSAQAHQVCYNLNCNRVLDLSFSTPYSGKFNTDNFFNQDIYSFDEFKYYIADVPFEEKWNLKITRNLEREKDLQNSVVPFSSYVVTATKTSDGNRDDFKYTGTHAVVEIKPLTPSVFDWLFVIENSEEQIIVDSCFVNLIEQLNISCKGNRFLLLRHGYYLTNLKDGYLKGKPRVKLKWKEI